MTTSRLLPYLLTCVLHGQESIGGLLALVCVCVNDCGRGPYLLNLREILFDRHGKRWSYSKRVPTWDGGVWMQDV